MDSQEDGGCEWHEDHVQHVEPQQRVLADLDATESQAQFPVLYTDALHGVCRREPDGADGPMLPLSWPGSRSGKRAAPPISLEISVQRW